MQTSKLGVILLTLALTGCACDPVIKVVTQRVEVPVAMPCKAEVPTSPDLNFDKLTSADDLYNKTRSLLSDRKLHQGYEAELLAALKSCK